MHESAALLYGCQRIGHRQFRIVVSLDSQNAVESLADVRYDLRQPARQHRAIGIAQRQHACAGLLRGIQRVESKIRIGFIAIEEMLCVVDHLLALIH